MRDDLKDFPLYGVCAIEQCNNYIKLQLIIESISDYLDSGCSPGGGGIFLLPLAQYLIHLG